MRRFSTRVRITVCVLLAITACSSTAATAQRRDLAPDQRRQADAVLDQHDQLSRTERRCIDDLARRGCPAEVIAATFQLRTAVVKNVNPTHKRPHPDLIPNGTRAVGGTDLPGTPPEFRPQADVLYYVIDDSEVEKCRKPNCQLFHRTQKMPEIESPIDIPWQLQHTIEMVEHHYPEVLNDQTLAKLQKTIAKQIDALAETDSVSDLAAFLQASHHSAFKEVDTAISSFARQRGFASARLMQPARNFQARHLEARLEIALPEPQARLYYLSEKRFKRLGFAGRNLKFRPNAWNSLGNTKQHQNFRAVISPPREETVVVMAWWPSTKKVRYSDATKLSVYTSFSADQDRPVNRIRIR